MRIVASNNSVDVIVIGAGIVGAACAHEFAERGLSVLVIDNGSGGATSAGMGHLVVMDGNIDELRLTRYSVDLWHGWRQAMPASCLYHGCGTLWLASDDHEMDLARARQLALTQHGVTSELIGPAALGELEPLLRPGLGGALSVPGDATVYAPAVAAWLLQRHPKIVVRQATAAAVKGNRVVLAGGDIIDASHVILANGMAAGSLLPQLSLRPKKGHLLITDRYHWRVQHQLLALDYVTSSHASDGLSVAFNVQPRLTGQLLIGSSREYDTLDRGVDIPVLARMLECAIGYLPMLSECNCIRAWTGFRAASPDGLPLLGPHPDQPGLWLALGHEGLGVTAAPASAKLLMALIFGETPPIDPAPYLPARLLTASISDTAS